jgi:phenylacetic acid degradation operon negative regulatory protein
MDWRTYFHHPDISLPVVRRRAAEALLDLLASYGRLIASNGRSLTWCDCFPSREAYFNAVRRLRESGLIAYRRSEDQEPVLALTDAAGKHTGEVLNPEARWGRPWSGIWYVLAYDVPEKRRDLRDALRGFLKRMRMGCLQRSVWVSADDVRPQYDDLAKAAGIESVSFLFEATTVLGRSSRDIVAAAWDFERLGRIQRWYGEVFEHNAMVLRSVAGDLRQLQALAAEELAAYRSAMCDDPLLPEDLLPSGYEGRRLCALHRAFVRAVRARARELAWDRVRRIVRRHPTAT